MTTYAQLDRNNIVIGISQLSDSVTATDMVEIPEGDQQLMGRLYQDGEFVPISYYAKLDEANIVREVIPEPSMGNIKGRSKKTENAVKLEHAAYELLGARYDGEKFTRPDMLEEAEDRLIAKIMMALKEA